VTARRRNPPATPPRERSTRTDTRRRAQNVTAIQVLMSGGTVQQAADACGINRRTLADRMNTPEFQAQLEAAETEMLERTRRAILTAAQTGLRTLVEAASGTNVPWPQRVSAGAKLVELAVGRKMTVTGRDGGPVELAATDTRDAVRERLSALADRLDAVPTATTSVDDDDRSHGAS